MNKEHDYGGVRDNQLRVLEHLGLLKRQLPPSETTQRMREEAEGRRA